MTHGCLLVKSENRSILLHTYHTGQAIPNCIDLALNLFASIYRQRMSEYHNFEGKPSHAWDAQLVADSLDRTAALERLLYAPSLAALLIASKPLFLEPVTQGSRKDLPEWSGLQAPYRLLVGKNSWVFHYQKDDEEPKKSRLIPDLEQEVVSRILHPQENP